MVYSLTSKRKQKEQQVIELYEEGRTYREIAQMLRMSPNTIKAILNREGLDQSTTESSRAYELFSEGKSPLNVAIELGIRQPQADEYHNEYWALQGRDQVARIYKEVEKDPWPFIKLYRMMKAAGMDLEDVREVLSIANYYLPSIKSKYKELRIKTHELELKKTYLSDEIQKMNREIRNLHSTLSDYRTALEKETNRIKSLKKEMMQLKSEIVEFKARDESYLEIEEIVEEKLSDMKQLLRCAVESVTESIRNDPTNNVSVLFFDKKDELSQLVHPPNYYNGYYQYGRESYLNQNYTLANYKEMLLDEAEKVYAKLKGETVSDVIEVYSSRITSPLSWVSMPDLPSYNEEQEDKEV
jgi:archaellum component FlaC